MISSVPLENLIPLIKCPSVTPNHGGALSVLKDVLEPLGFTVKTQIARQEGTADVHNLYARLGTKEPHLMFAGHTDVVPPGNLEDWRHPPFAAVVEDGKIYGRGTVDMKGNIACFIAAVSRFIEKNSDFGSISLLITGDEEGPAINGTRKALLWAKEQGEKWDSCIVGEPMSRNILGDTLRTGQRGGLAGYITIYGIQGHASRPNLANNPINGLIPLLHELTRVKFDEGNTDFPPTNLEVTTIDVGNSASNIIPGKVKLCFDIRFNNLWTEEKLLKEIRSRVDKGLQAANLDSNNESKLSYDLNFSLPLRPACLIKDEDLITMVSDSIKEITGKVPNLTTAGGCTDAAFIKDYCPVIECGLVGKTAHAVDENTKISDLEDLTRIYERLLVNWFAKHNASKDYKYTA